VTPCPICLKKLLRACSAGKVYITWCADKFQICKENTNAVSIKTQCVWTHTHVRACKIYCFDLSVAWPCALKLFVWIDGHTLETWIVTLITMFYWTATSAHVEYAYVPRCYGANTMHVDPCSWHIDTKYENKDV